MSTKHIEVRLESSDAALPCDHLRIHTLHGREAISALWSFELGLVCDKPGGLDAAALVGVEASLVFEREGVEQRRLHGMIAEVDDLLDAETDQRSYRVRLVPRAHRLALIETQDIFIDQTIPEVLEQKLELVGLKVDSELRLTGAYPKREFVTQYRETDLAFMSRLTEHLGISYSFEHQDGRDKLVWSDHNGGFSRIEGDTVSYRGSGLARDVFALELRRQAIPSMYVVQDYNYRTPLLDLTSSYEAPTGFGGGVIEYGVHVKTPEEAAALAKVRGEERLSTQAVFVGKSDLVHIAAGKRAGLLGHPVLHELELLFVEVEHAMTQVIQGAGGGDAQQSYTNTFRAIDAKQTFRPRRVTPRPRMPSVITGVVDPGPSGGTKTPQIDEQGRYTVRFAFDTGAAGARRASRPIRMAQPHGGANYGMHFPLKPGVEVLIAFVDGDPDRPIILSAVPNPTTPTPVDGREATTNRLKTSSGVMLEIFDGH